jgi:hypothetical protein
MAEMHDEQRIPVGRRGGDLGGAVPMVPATPAVFSTKNCLPSTLLMPLPIVRVIVSPGPPAA